MYRKPPIVPPWGGWNDSAPSLTLPNNSFKQITNWLINKQRLQSFPRLSKFKIPNDTILTARSFLDVMNVWHTVLLGKNVAYYLNADGTTSTIGAPWVPIIDLPY